MKSNIKCSLVRNTFKFFLMLACEPLHGLYNEKVTIYHLLRNAKVQLKYDSMIIQVFLLFQEVLILKQ